MQIEQKRIEKYWDNEASRYSENIRREMNSFKRKAWTDLIEEYRPAGESLKVLDIGTGPGFFAMPGFEAEFIKMDSHELTFADETFDLLLCRNLTWTLRDPQSAYNEWRRVLKTGGRLLIFDANGICGCLAGTFLLLLLPEAR